MELLTFNPKAPVADKKAPATIVWQVRLAAWAKLVLGFVFGILVGVIGLVAHPFFTAAECYRNHAWPWELFRDEP